MKRNNFFHFSDEQSRDWENFCDNFNHSELIGKTLLFSGHYSSHYPDFQRSGDAGRVITIDSIDDFMKFTGNHPDHVNIWQDKDGLHVSNYHHDGKLYLDVLLLTKNGEKYWKNTKNSPGWSIPTSETPKVSPRKSTSTSSNTVLIWALIFQISTQVPPCITYPIFPGTR